MKYTEPGTYKIQYTAEDGCGKKTVADRTVIVSPPPRTVLYTDGTFIINEDSADIEANVAKHGEATNVYPAFDPNATSKSGRYDFGNHTYRPWSQQSKQIKRVSIGSKIAPTSGDFWFYDFTQCETFDMSNFDATNLTKIYKMFDNCDTVTELDLSFLNGSNLTSISGAFRRMNSIKTLDLSVFSAPNLLYASELFDDSSSLESVDLSTLNLANISSTRRMFGETSLTSIDLGNMSGANVTESDGMFQGCRVLTTIKAMQGIDFTNATSSRNMFENCIKLVGGQGTRFNSSYIDNAYARIDGGTSNPGYFTAKE